MEIEQTIRLKRWNKLAPNFLLLLINMQKETYKTRWKFRKKKSKSVVRTNQGRNCKKNTIDQQKKNAKADSQYIRSQSSVRQTFVVILSSYCGQDTTEMYRF